MKLKAVGFIGALCLILGLVTGTGVAHAGLDDELSIIDSQGRTLTVQQWDTFLNGVAPLDRNRLTREWFHNGRIKYEVSGPGAEDFNGTMQLGYQLYAPWAMSVGLNFSYTTPNYQEWNWAGSDFPIGAAVTPPLLPGGSIAVDLSNGPGVGDVTTMESAVSGPSGVAAVANAHGTLTGVAGGVTLRPFARLVSDTGDSVTTYGRAWNMN
ncbi:MspA family porin [Mycobacterium sp. SMC-4]|uniref:MspA family porin n=1 Tax=Mycobacterium sp. SMC-4 TaxID=2857059 RepID=UPI003CFED3D2